MPAPPAGGRPTATGHALRVLGGRYELGDVLGRGAHGDVHAAHDARLGRDVAVKLLRPDLADDPELRRRFTVEARAAARLVHPNVVAVFDAGDDDDGVPYIVMERLPGASLAGALRRGPLPIGRACTVAAEILAALGAAHAHGIVHRDVKPANVLLTDDGHAKVADFGIAKVTSGTDRTATGVVVGTPAYLAPEVLAGAPATAASDVWAVGCLLHEMLTGGPPFTADTPLALVHAITTQRPPPVAAARPEVDPALVAVVDRALAAHPAQRYGSAHAMAEALAAAAPAATPAAAVTVEGGHATAAVAMAPTVLGGLTHPAGPPLPPTAAWLGPGAPPVPPDDPAGRVAAPVPSRGDPAARRAIGLGLGAAAVVALAIGLAAWPDDGTGAPGLGATTTAPPTETTTATVAVTTTAVTTTVPETTAPSADPPAPGNGNGRGNGNGNDDDD